MKRIILAVLMVALVTTPCFAQEIEADGLFSIKGTEWEALPIGLRIFRLPGIWDTEGLQFSFYDDRGPSYIDMLACSIFWQELRGSLSAWYGWYFGILQPIGIGVVVKADFLGALTPFSPPNISIALLVKTNDNWVPPEFGSISPNQGEQGTTLTNVTITGINTNIDETPHIIFRSHQGDEGMTVSNINVISDTEVEFDLEIAVDAPIGFQYVGMSYYDDKNSRRYSIEAYDAFEVLEQTN